MNMYSKRTATLVVVIILLLFFSLVQAAAEVTVKDKLGRVIQVSPPVRRAVLFETYELAAALGVWDRIAGISRYAFENDLILALKPDIARTIPSAGSGIDINIETLLRLKPDCVITWTFKPETIRFMEQKGLVVVAIYPESIAELYDAMRLQGKLFGKQKKVEDVIARMEKLFSFIRERCRSVPLEKRKRVVWLSGKPTTVSGGIGVNNDLLRLVNGINPAASIRERSLDVSMERIIVWNPDVVFIWGSAKYGADDLLDSPQWRHTAAVKNAQIYKSPKWGTWSPRLAVIALWMAMNTYPDAFRDVNFEKTADDFFRAVYGIPYAKVTPIEAGKH